MRRGPGARRAASPAPIRVVSLPALFLALALATGCVGSPAPRDSAPSAGTAAFERRVDPFPVLDAAGEPYGHAFLGGFNMPRPQLVDIDGDGDDDLFVQEATGSVMLFERTDGPRRFEWRTDRYQDLEVGEWYRFVDVDRDGDMDLLAEQPFSYVRLYRNHGTPAAPRFVPAADTLRTEDGQPIFSDRQNIPNATDIDCDGRLDLLIGRLVGTVSRFEEVAVDEGVPTFRLVTDRFEDIEIVAQIGSLRHGANTMALHDLDRDGDEDLFWGDFFEPGVLYIENTGTCTSPSLGGTPRSFPLGDPLRTSGYNAPTVGDVDGDGDADLLVGVLGGAFNPNTTSVDNFHYLEQTDAGFEHRTSRFLSTVDVGAESVPVLVDLDGDGDLDLLVGNKIEQDDTQNGKLYRYVNEGAPGSPRLRLDGTLDLPDGGYHRVPAFGDLDGDGDLDLVLGTWDDEVRLYRNEGSAAEPRWSPADSALVTLTRGRNATPALGDLDGDGDLDLLVGESSGEVNFYRNEGTASEPAYELVSESFEAIDVGSRSVPALVDLDGDGDLDLVVGSDRNGLLLVRNVGTRTAASFRPAGTLDVPTFGFAAPAFGDMDGDGDDDLFLGGTGGGLWYFERMR